MWSTGTSSTTLRMRAGISLMSFSFSRGMITILIWWRWAAMIFSLRPPMGSTRPLRVISPVMATSRFTGTLIRAEMMLVPMVMPAEGPSLGMAPSGTCTWMSILR